MWRLRGEVVPLGVVIRSLCLFLSLFKQVTCWVSQARIDWGHSLSVCPPQAALCGSERSPWEDACTRKGFPGRITPRHLRPLWWYLVAEDSISCPAGPVQGLLPVPSGGYPSVEWSRDYCLSPVGVTPLVDRKSGCWTGSLSLAHGLSSEPWFPNRWNDGD